MCVKDKTVRTSPLKWWGGGSQTPEEGFRSTTFLSQVQCLNCLIAPATCEDNWKTKHITVFAAVLVETLVCIIIYI